MYVWSANRATRHLRAPVAPCQDGGRVENGGWRTGLWACLIGVLAALLLLRAAGTHRSNLEVHRQCLREEGRLQRLKIEADRLRQERRALAEDPLYIESVLRWMSPDSPETR